MKKFLLYMREYLWRARLKTCLCVFPLRAGLFCLASLNILIALLQIVGIATGATSFLPVLAHVQSEALGGEDHSPGACVLPPSALLAFSSVLLAALYRLDVVLLGLYCCYVLGSIFLSLVVYGLLNSVINPLDLFLIIIDTIYQIYIMILARSLMIEIELANAGEKNEFIYNKDQGVVIIRDVESPPVGSYPALPEPGMTTSITTLATLHEGPEYDSRFNTLQRNNTLQSNSLRGYRTSQDPIDNNVINERSATLPFKDTAYVQRQINTQRLGAVQSLAAPSTFKTVGNIQTPLTTSQVNTGNTNALKKENSPTTVTTAVIETTDKPVRRMTDEITKAEKHVKNEDSSKAEEVPEKKKRGIFSKASKEGKKNKNEDEVSQSPNDSTSKPSTSKNETLRKETDKSNLEKAVGDETTAAQDKKEDALQKKKRGLFKRAEKKDNKDKKKKGKCEKKEESQDFIDKVTKGKDGQDDES